MIPNIVPQMDIDDAPHLNPASASSIAAGLVAALSDRREARARAAQARAVVVSRSADEIAGEYEEVYRDLVARRQRSGGTA